LYACYGNPNIQKLGGINLVTPLKSHLILQRIPNLEMYLDASNELRIQVAGRVVRCGMHGLAVLDAFAQPTPLQVALNKLKARGVQHWIELTGVIAQLCEAGVLRDPAQSNETPTLTASGYGAAPIHVVMLNDQARTSSFLAALREVVRPSDIVVEIGTGTGVLAIAAARAGAAHVYTIEASAMADVAHSIFARNQLADRITLIRGWSTEVELPKRADVLVSEMIGNDPLGERVLEVTRDARQRLLKPAARFIPGTLTLYGLPITIPHDELNKHMATAETLDRWQGWYDIDFTPLAEAADHSFYALFHIRSQQAVQWRTLSAPVVLAKIDFAALDTLVIDSLVEVQATAAGVLNGLLIYFEAGLGPTTMLSTHPAQVKADNHWRYPVWYFGQALPVQAGDCFTLHYQYGRAGGSSQVWLRAKSC